MFTSKSKCIWFAIAVVISLSITAPTSIMAGASGGEGDLCLAKDIISKLGKPFVGTGTIIRIDGDTEDAELNGDREGCTLQTGVFKTLIEINAADFPNIGAKDLKGFCIVPPSDSFIGESCPAVGFGEVIGLVVKKADNLIFGVDAQGRDFFTADVILRPGAFPQ